MLRTLIIQEDHSVIWYRSLATPKWDVCMPLTESTLRRTSCQHYQSDSSYKTMFSVFVLAFPGNGDCL